MALADAIAERISLEGFERLSWGIADALRLGDFFDDHGIPPQTITLAMIATLLIGIFMLLPQPVATPPTISGYCGDGVCSGAESGTCPTDCLAPEKAIRVNIGQEARPGSYRVDLYDQNNNMVGTQQVQNGGAAIFDASPLDYGTVVITDPDGGAWNSGPITPSGAEAAGGTGTEGAGAEGAGTETGGAGTEAGGTGTGAGGTGTGSAGGSVTYPGGFTQSPVKLVLPISQVCLHPYLEGAKSLKDSYLEYLNDTLAYIETTGVPPSGINTSCADLNEDWFITMEDRMCLSGIFDQVFTALDDCFDCNLTNPGETCHDGWDNDCDGQMDKDTYDNDIEEFYGSETSPIDACTCSEMTPCDTLWDVNGAPPLAGEIDTMRCSSIRAQGGADDYKWRLKTDWGCTPGRSNWTLTCGGVKFKCNNFKGNWAWVKNNCTVYPEFDTVCGVEGGLVAYYPFDGSTADDVGNNRGKAVGRSSYVSGVSGQAYYFDGESYVYMNNRDSLSPASNDDALTVAFWANLSSSNFPNDLGGHAVLVAKAGDADSRHKGKEWEFRIYEGTSQTPRKITFTLYTKGSTVYEVSFTEPPFTGKAVHIAGVVGDGMMSIYRNGMLMGSQPVPEMPPKTRAYMYVGGNATGGYFQGSIDELLIFDRALAKEEIGKLNSLSI